ncbi:thioredoxin family protein [Haploplasma axanthum]|uniref:Glutaredoxin-like protein, YruB-family n=1 Tax=Haploplasma axanthum TaxID=29552 RepID=A0A449BE07_HAPAX|nr:thioredoxin family protein [Haploplasma axanthum]VEU80540.1 glutaredoxin-like protein, YruB-family [Haploplasma axanthum]
MKITILTKTDCPMCNKLKMYIEHALKDDQKAKLDIILKEDNEELFNELVKKHLVLAVPTAILNDEAYPGLDPAKLSQLLKQV